MIVSNLAERTSPNARADALYRQNIRKMATAFRQHADANVVLITPTPVVESIVNSLPDFVPMRMTWDNEICGVRRYHSQVRQRSRFARG